MHYTSMIDDIQYISVNVSNGGIFTCSMSVLVHLDPSEKATFSLLNDSQVKEGDSVSMKCMTDGNPQPEFDFLKDVRLHFMYKKYTSKREKKKHLCSIYFSAFTRVSCLSSPILVHSSPGKIHRWSGWPPDTAICQAHRLWFVQVLGHRLR